jgi:RNA polymerase sigma-70 factor, ECF subfamily
VNSQAATTAAASLRSAPVSAVPTSAVTVKSAPLSADIIRRAQAGEAEAFATLFHAHKSRVYSLCLRMTNNIAEAEDLAQDAFLQVFRKLGTFRGDSALSTWLHRITVNTVLMHFRRKSPVKVSLDDTFKNDGESKPVRREFGRKDGRLETAVSRLALTRAISELPEGYRTIFILHEVDGYEHREIAELLGCSIGNSKSQLHKAKLKMREMLATKADLSKALHSEPSNAEFTAELDTFAEAPVEPLPRQPRRTARRLASANRVSVKVKSHVPDWTLPLQAVPGLAATMPLTHSNA